MAREQIDRDKLRAAIRRLGHEAVFYLLDSAIDLLPPSKLLKLIAPYLDPANLVPDGKAKGDLLSDVKAFEAASLAGEYYEDFKVDSKNYMEKSRGTTAWIAECQRLLGRCVASERKGDSAEVRQAFDILFGLLDRVDECLDDVVFFADEGGSWQVGVDWDKVLPPWIRLLAATADPDEFARRITGLLASHYGYGSEKMLAVARATATPGQREALSRAAGSRGGLGSASSEGVSGYRPGEILATGRYIGEGFDEERLDGAHAPDRSGSVDGLILRTSGDKNLSTREIAGTIGLTPRATRTRLASLVGRGLLRETGSSRRIRSAAMSAQSRNRDGARGLRAPQDQDRSQRLAVVDF